MATLQEFDARSMLYISNRRLSVTSYPVANHEATCCSALSSVPCPPDSPEYEKAGCSVLWQPAPEVRAPAPSRGTPPDSRAKSPCRERRRWARPPSRVGAMIDWDLLAAPSSPPPGPGHPRRGPGERNERESGVKLVHTDPRGLQPPERMLPCTFLHLCYILLSLSKPLLVNKLRWQRRSEIKQQRKIRI